MKFFYALFNIVFFTIIVSSCKSSQKFEGIIEYKIEYDLPEHYESQRPMLATSMTYYIGKKFTRLEQKSTLGDQATIYLAKYKQTISLFDFFGKNIAVIQKPDSENEPLKVELLETTKEIVGFQCKSALVFLPQHFGDRDKSVKVFYTESIASELNSQFPGVNGFALEYQLQTQGMTITYKAVKAIAQKIDDKLSEIPKNYTLMTIDEFMKLMGG